MLRATVAPLGPTVSSRGVFDVTAYGADPTATHDSCVAEVNNLAGFISRKRIHGWALTLDEPPHGVTPGEPP